MKRSFGFTGAAVAAMLVALPAGAMVTIDQITGGGDGRIEATATNGADVTTTRESAAEPTRPEPTPPGPPTEPESPPSTERGAEPERPTTTAPRAAEPERRAEFSLECAPRSADGIVVIRCAWRAEGLDGVAGFRVLRGVDGAVAPVARTQESSFVDRDVVPGVRYGYAVEALNGDGRVVGMSNKSIVGIEVPVTPMRLFCAPRSIEDRVAVVCEWPAVERDGVRAYQLWKSVGDGPRQLLATVGAADGVRRYVDRDVAPGSRIKYAVTAIGGAGQLLAKSEPVIVEVPKELPRPTTTAPTTTRTPEASRSSSTTVQPTTSLAGSGTTRL